MIGHTPDLTIARWSIHLQSILDINNSWNCFVIPLIYTLHSYLYLQAGIFQVSACKYTSGNVL